MSSKKKHLLAVALTGALCAWTPVLGICHPQAFAVPQDAAPKQDTRDEESAKKSKKDSHNDKTVKEKSKAEGRPEQPAPNAGKQTPQEQARQPAAQQHAAKPAANAHYQFRSQDRSKLRQHFQSQLAQVNRANRTHISAGVTLGPTYQTYIVPVPQEVIVTFAPPPPGYVFGYYDGYVFVYDPSTFFVIEVIDLL